MQIIAEYRALFEQRSVLASQISTHERALIKLAGTYAPEGVTGMTYEKAKVQSSRHVPEIDQVSAAISTVKSELLALKKEHALVDQQLKSLDVAIETLGDRAYQVMRLKIRGCSNREIGLKLNYSKRQVERIVKAGYEALNHFLSES